MENINTEDLVESLLFIDPNYKNEINAIEQEYKCKILCDIEKHNVLQYTYFYEIDFGLKEKFYVEIESGINRGTQLNNDNWGVNTLSRTKQVSVVKDVILDESYYKNKTDFFKAKAQAILDRDKKLIFEHIRKDNYDNYVTGGNSKMKAEGLWTELYLDYIHEEIEVDRNFV